MIAQKSRHELVQDGLLRWISLTHNSTRDLRLGELPLCVVPRWQGLVGFGRKREFHEAGIGLGLFAGPRLCERH